MPESFFQAWALFLRPWRFLLSTFLCTGGKVRSAALGIQRPAGLPAILPRRMNRAMGKHPFASEGKESPRILRFEGLWWSQQDSNL